VCPADLMPPDRNTTIASVSVVVMITMTTRGVIVGLDLRSVTTTGSAGTTCVISLHRSARGVAVISSVSGSPVAIAFADLRKSGDGIGAAVRGVGSG
jgi:hypothetical protein